MAEKAIPTSLTLENYWEKRDIFMKMNKSGSVPFLVKKATESEINSGNSNLLLSGVNAILEYLEDKHDSNLLIFGNPEEKAEIRRMIDWVNIKFYQEVVMHALHEKIINFFKNQEMPDPILINISSQNLLVHIDYFGYLLSKRGWIASHKISMADFALASHISVLDYLGMINWGKMTSGNKEFFKDWYRIIKSRPSFRALLQDGVAGFNPANCYRDLDF